MHTCTYKNEKNNQYKIQKINDRIYLIGYTWYRDRSWMKRASFRIQLDYCMRFTLVRPTTVTNKYRGIPGNAVFFDGKYRGQNFQYRPSLMYCHCHYIFYGKHILQKICTIDLLIYYLLKSCTEARKTVSYVIDLFLTTSLCMA